MRTYCQSDACAFGRVCVPSWGNRDADIMFIAEAPGYREVQELEPMVGPAGRQFNVILEAVGLSRPEVFIANTVGCVDLDRDDRRPLPAEIDACAGRLMTDIAMVRPKVIVVMGNISLRHFFPGEKISAVRGKIRNWHGIPVVATFHPAYTLPHRTPEATSLIIEDIKLALSIGRQH